MGLLDWLFGSGGRAEYVRHESSELIDQYDRPRSHLTEPREEIDRFIRSLERETGLSRETREFPIESDRILAAAEAARNAAADAYGFKLNDPDSFDRLFEGYFLDPSAEGDPQIPNVPLFYYALGAAWGEWLRENRGFEWVLHPPLDPIQAFDDLDREKWMSFMPPFSHVTKKLLDPDQPGFAARGHSSLIQQMGPPPRALLATPADAAEAHHRLVGSHLEKASIPRLARDEAIASLNAAIKERPESGLVAFYAAELAAHNRDWPLTRRCLETLISLHDLPHHHLSLANCLMELDEEPESVLRELDAAISGEASFWKAHLMRASFLAAIDRPDEARSEIDTTLKMGPPDAVVEDAHALLEEINRPSDSAGSPTP